ncbi:MAG: hypothetical protein IJ593_07795, partial [Lachnospiraceae bacterium]|nr:hypothetical protein [Lachnospiraceae bacterium]
LPDNIKPRFGVIRDTINSSSKKVDNIPNTCTIIIKPAGNATRLLSGQYSVFQKRVCINLKTDAGGEDKVRYGYEVLEQIKDKIDKLNNVIVTLPNEKIFSIIKTQRTVDSNYIGLNEQGIHTFSLEYIIFYN